jgi:hypothetical protein
VVDGLVEPGVARHDADAHHVDVGRQQQHGDRDGVGAAGPGGVLVDEHLDAVGAQDRTRRQDRDAARQTETPKALHGSSSAQAARERQRYRV